MKIYKLKDFKKGWFVGNFEPSILKTKDFELGFLFRKKGKDASHFHKLAIEYNLLIKGKLKLNGKIINPGDLFILNKNEVAEPYFLEDTYIVCLKTPSIPGDKYIINND